MPTKPAHTTRIHIVPMSADHVVGWRTLWRDVRAGELRLLIVAVTLAVGALTAVGFFADRLQGGLQRDARQLLGGDAVISSDNPTPRRFIDQARAGVVVRGDHRDGLAADLLLDQRGNGDFG